MLLDRLQHLGKAPEHVRADRLALERAGPHPRQLALVCGDAEMIGPEHDQTLGEAAIDHHGALQPRQRLGAKGLLDHVEGLRRRFCNGRSGGIGLHTVRLHRIVGRLVVGRFDLGHLAGDLGHHRVQREIAPQCVVGLLVGRRLRRRRFGRCGRLCRRLARLLDLVLIGERGLPELRRRLQARRLQQRACGAGQFRLHETSGIGGRIDEIPGCPAAGAEAEAIQRDEGGLRIAGHRFVLRALPSASMVGARRLIYRSRR